MLTQYLKHKNGKRETQIQKKKKKSCRAVFQVAPDVRRSSPSRDGRLHQLLVINHAVSPLKASTSDHVKFARLV
jgi:hypothetical protein